MRILLLGGWQESAFVILKALGGRPEYEFYVADCWPASATRLSRRCREFFLLPHWKDEERYVEAVKRVCVQKGIDCLLPLPQEEMILISKFRDSFAGLPTRLLVPEERVMTTAVDKVRLGRALAEAGINYPVTYPADEFDGKRILEEAGLPLITKLTRGTGQKDQRISYDAKTFLDHLDYVVEKYGANEVLVQRFIPGSELEAMYTTGLLCDETGEVRLVVPTKKIRSRPYTGGSGSCVTALHHPQVADICVRTLQAIGPWQGICDIEVKHDKERDEYYVIEINPRPWGSPMMSLIKSGADIISWWIRLTMGQDVPKMAEFEEGVYTTDLMSDFLIFTDAVKDLINPRKRPLALQVLASYRRPYLDPGRFGRHELIADLDLRDPLPFLGKMYRCRQRLFWAVMPSNRDRRE